MLTNAEIIQSLNQINQARAFVPVPGQRGLPGKLLFALRKNAQKLERIARVAGDTRDDIFRQHGGLPKGDGGWTFGMNIEKDATLSEEEDTKRIQEIANSRLFEAIDEAQREVMNKEESIQLHLIPWKLCEDLPISDSLIPLWMVTLDEESEIAENNGQAKETVNA